MKIVYIMINFHIIRCVPERLASIAPLCCALVAGCALYK